MSEYSSLKATINANVKTNDNKEITGSILNSVLNAMVNALGAGYQLMGIATPSSPGSDQTPDYKCVYLATTPGTYSHLGGLVVADGEVALLKYDSSWTKEVTGMASVDSVNQLGQNVAANDFGKQLLSNTGRPNGSHGFTEPLLVGQRYYCKVITNQSLTFDITLRSETGASGEIVQTIAESSSRPAGTYVFPFVCESSNAIYLRIGPESTKWVGIDNQYMYEALATTLEKEQETIQNISDRISSNDDSLVVTASGVYRLYGNFTSGEPIKVCVNTITKVGTGTNVIYIYQGENLLKTITKDGIYDIELLENSLFISLQDVKPAAITSLQVNINMIKGTNLVVFEKAPMSYLSKPEVWMPKRFYMLKGTKVEVFRDSIAKTVYPKSYAMTLKNPNNSNCGFNRGYKYEYQVGNNDDFILQFGVENELFGEVYAENQTEMIHVNKKNSPSSAKNILCIGDSFTADGRWVCEFKRLLTGIVTEGKSDTADSNIEADSLTNLNFIGTTTSSVTPTQSFGGASYKDFIESNSPFWNPSTNKVDFDYYCSQNGYSGIDYCIILLGTNGYATPEYIAPLWDALLEHNPNIKVLIMGMCFANPYGAGAGGIQQGMTYMNLSASTFITNKRLEEMTLLDEYKDNFLYVDYGCQIDIFENMRFFEMVSNNRNPNALRRSSTDPYDTVHPYTYSYWEIADAVRAGFHYWCLNPLTD